MKIGKKEWITRKQKNKAFTLIELLAVIVILVVITLIATPIVLNIIKQSKKSAFLDSAYGIVESARLLYTESILDGGLNDDQTFVFDEGKPAGLTFSGSIPEGGVLQLTSKGEITLAIHNGEWCATKTKTESKVTLKKYVEGECVIPDTASDPIITLNGEKEIILKIGEVYQEFGAIARTVEGSNLSYKTVIKKQDQIVDVVETNKVGSYIITYTAENNGKSASVTRTVSVIDGNGPVITFDPETVTLESEEVVGYDLFKGVTVTDETDGSIDSSKIKVTGELEKFPGTYTITYEVTNSNGTKTSRNRTFIVEDRTKPNVEIEPIEEKNYVRTKTITIKASDNIKVKNIQYILIKDGERQNKVTIQSGDKITLNENGNYEIEITATDSSDNITTVTSGVYKIDTVPPVITPPAKTTVKITEAATYNIYEGVVVTDNSGEEVTLTASGDLSAELGEYTVTYKAIDGAGNEATKSTVFTVVEADGPILNFSDIGSDTWRKATTITVYATDTNNLSSFTYEIIKDDVSMGVENVVVSGKSAEHDVLLDQDGTYRIKLTGSDEYGNQSTATSSTYKIDSTPPTAGRISITGTLGDNDWYTSNVTIVAIDGTDALSGHASTTVDVKSITSNTEGTTVTVTSTDNVGNSSTRRYVVKVDKTAPTFTVKSTTTASVKEETSVDITTYFNTPTYSISGGSLSCDAYDTTYLEVGTHSIVCTARGGNGLTKTATKKITITSKCPTYTIMGKSMASCEILAVDPGKNKRYVGTDPNNYVWFNNERWRIIGIFSNQAKIIKDDHYSTAISWDDNDVWTYTNDWSKATLQTELNGSYLNSLSDADKIDQTHKWNLGGASDNALSRSKFYSAERGTTVYSGRPTTWTGAIGLMYPSDLGYSITDEDSTCNTAPLNNWGVNCEATSWLKTSYDEWTLTPNSKFNYAVFSLNHSTRTSYTAPNNHYAVRPVLFLKSTVKITGGTGSYSDPFTLSDG